MLLQDKVAVITGGGYGIGRVIALTYAKAGANVVLAARSAARLEETKAEIEALGGRALAVPTDITQEADVQRLAEQALAHFGQVDVLVNNSGIGGPVAPLWEVEPAEWEKTFDVNVKGAYLCCRAFLPSMTKRQTGSIIMIGSMTGKRPLLNRSAYCASKTALIGLVRALAWDAAPYNVRVNLISPGAVDGERIKWGIRSLATAHNVSFEEAQDLFTRDSPFKRLVTPEEIANTALFLASDMATGTTGEDVNVSAGVVMY